MIARTLATLLCGVGVYVSAFMFDKSRRAARGEVPGPSVVKTRRAHLLGVPNSLLGLIYYPAIAIAVWLLAQRWELLVVLAIALGAAITSAVLAYSLLFITRRQCPYCWTAHSVNWALLVLCGWLFLQAS
ncbi:MAG: vitamin K epoxide reductase family protein [Candidatus Eremiobacteraeota bacterium]|nr:vitamin K epoxide reductase family protein [Candidatus Eremiobacteraeota bacterium]